MTIQFDRLLSVDSAKAEKAVQYGYLNGIHYMAPARTSGFNLCVNATDGCIDLCLGKSRIKRTEPIPFAKAA